MKQKMSEKEKENKSAK